MSRHIGITDAETTTAFRAVGEYLVDGERRLIYAGLHDKVGPARQRVTWWREHPGYRAWIEPADAEVSFVDAWVEPVTVVNHPGVRYTNDWTPPANDVAERLKAISEIADAIDPPGDTWALTHAIVRLAKGTYTVAQAREWLGDGWETL